MNCNAVSVGLRVVVARLESTDGMLIHPRHLEHRRAGARGAVTGYVPGHGGDVWFVRHDSGIVSAYCFTEIEPEPQP